MRDIEPYWKISNTVEELRVMVFEEPHSQMEKRQRDTKLLKKLNEIDRMLNTIIDKVERELIIN